MCRHESFREIWNPFKLYGWGGAYTDAFAPLIEQFRGWCKTGHYENPLGCIKTSVVLIYGLFFPGFCFRRLWALYSATF
jgi:hypothetical protein